MAKVLANGQITIVDLNDGKAVQCFTQTSKGETQIYTPDTNVYTPSYSSSAPNVVTAKVYVTGNATDQASSCTGWKWTVNGTEVTSSNAASLGVALVSGSGYKLNLISNIASTGSTKNIGWSCTYTDSNGAATQCMGYKTISLAKSGGALQTVQIETPNGNTFDSSNSGNKLTAVAKFYRGNVQDTSVSSIVWKKLNISAGTWGDLESTESVSTTNGTSTLSVSADDVLNFQTFKCTVTDGTDTAYAIVTFFDASDPYTVEVYTLTGDKIVNGAQSTELFARVWKDGEVKEDGATVKADTQHTTQFKYVWTKYDTNGAAANWNGTTSSVNASNLPYVTVSKNDVNVRNTFTCEVSSK